MKLYITSKGIPHVTLEEGGKRYRFWPLFDKLTELSKGAKREVEAPVTTETPASIVAELPSMAWHSAPNVQQGENSAPTPTPQP